LIKLLDGDDDDDDDITIVIIGTVDSIGDSVDPALWSVAGIEFLVDDDTVKDEGIIVDDLVRVTLVLKDGKWVATEIELLGDDEDEIGCFTITAEVMGISGDDLDIDGWPPLIIGDSDVDGEIEPGSLIVITMCISEDGTITVISIIVISGLPPGDDGDGERKVTLCHKPNGNNPHTITVGAPAVPAHEAHGDTIGACNGGIGNGIGGDDDADADDKGGRVLVCHKAEGNNPRNRWVSQSALQPHLNHGDTTGECNNGNDDD
jgi:hypothetical protein